MKKFLVLFLMFMMWTGTQAQNSRRDKIKALAAAYITEQINLTTNEAEKFWPVYNQIKQKCRSLEKEKRELIRAMEQEFDGLSNDQAAKYVDRLAYLEDQIHRNKLENNSQEIIAIIGSKRFLMLHKAEHDFRRKMIREYKERRKKEE